MLNAYLAQVESLLDDFGNVEYSLANLTTYINDARVQIALSSESLRPSAQLVLVVGQESYPLSVMTFPAQPTPTAGLGGVANVRSANLQLPNNGLQRLETRAWEWFNTFYYAQPVKTPGPPTIFARLQPGLINGNFYINPPPDQAYTLQIGAVAYPIPLVDDTTTEALNAPWTEAVQYYSAYLALLSAQRRADAEVMWERYLSFEMRGTQLTTPTRLPGQYPGGGGAQAAGTHRQIAMPPPRGR
jgi:hypothetical protein